MYEVAISHHITPKLFVFFGHIYIYTYKNNTKQVEYVQMCVRDERKRMKEQQEHLLCYMGHFIVYSLSCSVLL